MPKPEIPATYEGLPVLTAAQSQALDRLATEKHGIPASDLMERAGEAVARETLALAGKPKPSIVVVCGRGSNGGDGLVAARHLAHEGARVTAFICPAKKDSVYPELVRSNLELAREAGVKVAFAGEGAGLSEALASCDAAVDALLGTGSAGKPAGQIHHMIQELNRSKKPVVAVDIPSGVHPDTGYHSGVFVNAAVTVTFGWAKRGLVTPHAQKNVGRLVVADIGYPRELLGNLKTGA